MLLTSNFGLKKPEATDPVDVQDFNDNADIIDTELKKRPESDGSATNMTVEFAAATQLTELTSKDSLKGLFGKLALAVKTVIGLTKTAITTSNIGNQSVKYADSAGAVAWGNVSGKPSAYTPTSHTHGWDAITGKPSAYTPAAHTHDYIPASASCNKNWNWVGKEGQPPWVWGGETPNDMYVYNPTNFTVNYAYHLISGAAGNVRVALSGEGANFRTYVKSTGAALDNAVNLGSGSYRWKQVFAGTSAISTSDRNLKKDINKLTENHLKFFLMLMPVSYQFIDGDSGRTHIGFIAQDVEDAMEQCGLTALDFAGFCKDVKTVVYWEKDENSEKIEKERPVLDADGNPEYIYSLRYEEFIALVTYATQKLYSRVDTLESRLEQMEARLAALEK